MLLSSYCATSSPHHSPHNYYLLFILNFFYKYIYIYIYWLYIFIFVDFNIYIYLFFISNFPIIFFYIHLFFKIFTFSSTFLLPSPFHLPTTFYFNIVIHLSLHLPLFVSSYPFPLTINLPLFSILCIIFSHKKVLSLSLSPNVLVDFYFLLHLRFRLINFCIFKNSNLCWYDLVLCFKLLLLLFCSLIVKFYAITL